MANRYPLGSRIQVSGAFAAADRSLVDPDTLELQVKSPSGAVTVYAYPADVIKRAVGIYYFDFTPDASGTWSYRWSSTGNGQAAAENSFSIDPSNF